VIPKTCCALPACWLGVRPSWTRNRAFIIAEVTGTCCETLQDYDDAGRAMRRWFALTVEPGARH
jgi:hypothetical protein